MTTRAATFIADDERWATRIAWSGLLNGDVGAAIKFVPFADRSVQITGTFGAGGTLVIEGSNDSGANWVTLRDPAGAALSFTSADLRAIQELPFQIRPRVTSGDGSTNLQAHLSMRSAGR